MANIIDITNKIGKEVSRTLFWRKRRLYYQETALLYSLIENMLKYMVGMKNTWDKNSQLVENNMMREDMGEVVPDADYKFDFGAIREKASKLTFCKAIDEAYSLDLIPESLRDKLHTFRHDDRNRLVHELYLFDNRNKPRIMRQKLKEAQSIARDVVTMFEHLIFDEIGVDTEEVLQTLDVK